MPCVLTSQQKEQVSGNNDFLKKYKNHGNQFLGTIIIADETLVSLNDPITKQDSSVWQTPNSPSPIKALVRPSAKKLMFIAIFDMRAVILSRAAPSGKIVTAHYHSTTTLKLFILYCFYLRIINYK